VPNSTADEMNAAVDAAKEAYKSWSKTSILTRQQIMFKYQDIIRKNMVCLNYFEFIMKLKFVFYLERAR